MVVAYKMSPNTVPAPGLLSHRAAVLDVATVALACAVFLTLCLYQLKLPGLYYDEAFDVVPTVQLLTGHTVELQRNVGLLIFGWSLPLMSSSDYQGVTSTYLVLPFFALGGINVVSLRLMTVLVGVLGLVLAFFLARSWFGPAEARLAVLMLAVSPAWVFWSRLGVYVVAEVVPIATGTLLALSVWIRWRPFGERNWPLYLGMFLLGLGLATKLLFLWLMVALPMCALVLWGRIVWEHRRLVASRLGHWLRVAVTAGVAFCAGAFPFLLYNVWTKGTYYVLRASLGGTSHGVNNTAVMRNLYTEADAFKVLLDGGYFWMQGVRSHVYSNPLTPALLAISALGLVAFVLVDRRRNNEQATRPLIVGGVMLALALALSFFLGLGVVGVRVPAPLMAATLLLGVAGAGVTLVASLRRGASVAIGGWTVLVAVGLSGVIWWFGGSGRPEEPAPGAWLGLWPVDAAGVIFWVSGAALVLLLGLDRRPVRYQRTLAAMLGVIGLVVGQSAVTLSGLWSTHLLLLLPLPQIAIAAFAAALGRRLAGRLSRVESARVAVSARAAVAVLLVGAIVLLDLGVDFAYHHDLAITGGNSTFSDAIYRLADYLQNDKQGQQVVAMDWGFRRPIQLLTQEQVDPTEAYGSSTDIQTGFYENLRKLFARPDTVYLFHVEDDTAFHRRDAFLSEALAAGKKATLEKTFYQRDGNPVYDLFSVR